MIKESRKHFTNNRQTILQDSICGCIYCMEIFSPSEITAWIEDPGGTATCPYCTIDSVVGESSGYPITKEVLAILHEYWFNSATKKAAIALENSNLAKCNACIKEAQTMDINDFTQRIAQVDWGKYDRPEYFENRTDGITSFAQTVPQALVNLALADKGDKETFYELHGADTPIAPTFFDIFGPLSGNAKRPSDAVLNVLGWSYSRYYPVAMETLPFITEIALHGNTIPAKSYAIAILRSLYSSATYAPDGTQHALEPIQTTINNHITTTFLDEKNHLLSCVAETDQGVIHHILDHFERERIGIPAWLKKKADAYRKSLEENFLNRGIMFEHILDAACVESLKDKWVDAFAQGVDLAENYISTGVNSGRFLWHLFSYEKRRYLTKEAATQAFLSQDRSLCYLFFQNREDAYALQNAEGLTKQDLIDNIDFKSSDLYVVDKDFTWTYALDHENYGPFYYHVNMT